MSSKDCITGRLEAVCVKQTSVAGDNECLDLEISRDAAIPPSPQLLGLECTVSNPITKSATLGDEVVEEEDVDSSAVKSGLVSDDVMGDA